LVFKVPQVIEVQISIISARTESHIILEPINTSYLVDHTLASEVRWHFTSVKVIDVDQIILHSHGKVLATMGK
jgi:hypothetical protein